MIKYSDLLGERKSLTKPHFSGIIAVYKQYVKTTRLSARTIFKLDAELFSVYNLTTVYRNYLLIGTYLQKTIAIYKIPTFSRLQ